MRGARIGGAVVGALAVAAFVAGAYGGRRWDRATAAAVARLGGGRAGAAALDEAELAGLPDPVARYLVFALTPGRPLPRRARVQQEGRFLLDASWRPFGAVAHLAAHPPGFVWDAAIRLAPLVDVRVRDGYHAGAGHVLGAVAGLVTVAEPAATRELAEASLQRWLAEAVWLPSALLPSTGVAWTAIDATSARATLTDHGVTASVDFEFGARGEVTRVSAQRWRDVGGRMVRTPWEGRWRDWQRVDGVTVPASGEAAWLLPEGRRPYWRGRVTTLEIDEAP